jgi:hypothetical protein
VAEAAGKAWRVRDERREVRASRDPLRLMGRKPVYISGFRPINIVGARKGDERGELSTFPESPSRPGRLGGRRRAREERLR